MRVLILLLLPVPLVFAQSMEFSASAGAINFGNNPVGFLGYGLNNTPADAVAFRTGSAYMFRFGWNHEGRFGHEFGMAYHRYSLDFEVGAPVMFTVDAPRASWQGFYDLLVYTTREESKVRPFVAGGAGLTSFRVRASTTTPTIGQQESTEFAVNYGAGVKIGVRKNSFIRFDFREYRGPKPLKLISEGWLAQREFSAGAGFKF